MTQPPWREYQHEAAAHFARLGMSATVEEPLEGARATHAIDVVVRFRRYGLEHLWIVECKRWRTAVGKAEVLVLQQVVADVGADRAFLLSEQGFQSGAIAAARWSNVTLTGLDDLVEAAEQDAVDDALAQINRRLAELTRRMHDQTLYTGMGRWHPAGGLEVDSVLEIHADAFYLGLQLQRAIAGGGVRVADQELTEKSDVVEHLRRRLEALDANVEGLSKAVNEAIHGAQAAVVELADAVDAFFVPLRAAVDHRDSPAAESHYGQAVLGMRRIADAADRLAAGAPPDVVQKVGVLMRHLIDHSYLKAAGPDLAAEEIDTDRDVVKGLVAEVVSAAEPAARRTDQAASRTPE